MKKKSFFRSFNAKLALAVLAVSGALLTGCSKDEGLDIEIPGVEIPQVDTKYQITGSVFDAETGNGLKATVTIDGAAVVVSDNGGFSKEVTPGERKIVVEMATFKTVTRTVSIAELPAKGHTAVYPVEIGLVKANPAETYVDAKYAAQVVAYLEDGSILAADQYAAEFKKGGAAVTDLANMAAGIYDFTVTPTDAAKYKPYTAKVNFANIKVPAGSAAINVLVEAQIANVVTPEPQPTITKLTANFVDKTGNFVNVTRAWLTTSKALTEEVEGSVRQNVNQFVYEYEGEFKVSEYVLNYQFSKKDGSIQKGTKAFDAHTLASVEINTEGAATPPPAVVPIPDTTDGDVTIDIEDAGAEVTMPQGLTATDASGEVLEVMTIQRKTDEETEEPAALRVFEGQPSGATFEPALEVAFADAAGGELGTMQLEYLKDGVWVKEAGEGSAVELKDGKYIMKVSHFSEFRAATVVNISSSSRNLTPSDTLFTINKGNTTEEAKTITYTYKVKTGTEISEYETIVDGLFTSIFARNIVKAIIQTALENDGYVAKPWKMVETEVSYSLPSKKYAESITATYTGIETVYNFSINNKQIDVVVNTAKTELGDLKIVDIEHGHGNGSNAGGGSADGE